MLEGKACNGMSRNRKRATADGSRYGVSRLRIERTEHIIVLALALIAVASILVAAVTKPSLEDWGAWISSLAMSLAGGIAASLLTFLLIDLMLANQREAESHEAYERERRERLLSRLRAGPLEENRSVLEQLRSAGSLKDGALRDADFTGANLEGLDFSGADLRGALFVGCCLRQADFRNADVSMARFTHADLRGARFDGAITEGVDFTMIATDENTLVN
jgi:hypothetical protein